MASEHRFRKFPPRTYLIRQLPTNQISIQFDGCYFHNNNDCFCIIRTFSDWNLGIINDQLIRNMLYEHDQASFNQIDRICNAFEREYNFERTKKMRFK